MIVHCNFEELSALKVGARQVLDGYAPEPGMIAAPPEEREQVAALMLRLGGDFSIKKLMTKRSTDGGSHWTPATVIPGTWEDSWCVGQPKRQTDTQCLCLKRSV